MAKAPRIRTLKAFRMDVAARLMDRTIMNDQQCTKIAFDLVKAFLEENRIKFGDPAYDWGTEAAYELADEDLDHW